MNTLAAPVAIQERAIKALDSLPPFSPVLNKLLATLAYDDVPFSKFAELIEKDTVLSGNVLRVVNSAAYSCRGKVNSVAHAIAIMGLNKLRNTALSFSVSRFWRGLRCAPGFSMARFNLHSIATALMSDSLAQRLDVNYPEGAFTAGLFHDMGKLMLAVGAPNEYEQLLRTIANGEREVEEVEKELLGVTHSDLSAIAIERWNLPRPIQTAIAFHHDPLASPPDAFGSNRFALAEILVMADALVREMGITVESPQTQFKAKSHFTLQYLGLNEDSPEILKSFQDEYQVIKAMF